MGFASSLAVGCMSVAKVGYKVVKGAEAHVDPIREVSPEVLREYGKVTLGEVTTDVGPICPERVLEAVRMHTSAAFGTEAFKQVFPGGDKTLTVDLVCRFFKEKPLIGSESRLDAVASLLDGESKEEVGRLYIEGLSDSIRAHGLDDLARKNAQELTEYLMKRRAGERE